MPFPSPRQESESEFAQSCLTFRDPMDCSLPGSSVHGIFQARVLEWGADGVTTILNWTYYSVLFTGVILIYTYLTIWLYKFLTFVKMVSVIIKFFVMLSSITLCFKLDPDV